MYSPLTLAFLGDAVYSLLVRNMLSLSANKPTGKLHKESIHYVNAAFQAQMIRELLPVLTEDETAATLRLLKDTRINEVYTDTATKTKKYVLYI